MNTTANITLKEIVVSIRKYFYGSSEKGTLNLWEPFYLRLASRFTNSMTLKFKCLLVNNLPSDLCHSR